MSIENSEQEREFLQKKLESAVGKGFQVNVRKVSEEELEFYEQQEKRTERFTNLRSKGIIRGLLITSLLLFLYFYPFFVSSQEILPAEINSKIEYFSIFLDISQILLLVIFEGGLLLGFSHLCDRLDELRLLKEFNDRQETEIISDYT